MQHLFRSNTKTCKIINYHSQIRFSSQLSGLQKQVLSLYRKLLRTSNQKDHPQPFLESIKNVDSITFTVKTKFREKAMALNKRDVTRIEYNIRQGEKYVKTLQMNGVKGMKSTST